MIWLWCTCSVNTWICIQHIYMHRSLVPVLRELCFLRSAMTMMLCSFPHVQFVNIATVFLRLTSCALNGPPLGRQDQSQSCFYWVSLSNAAQEFCKMLYVWKLFWQNCHGIGLFQVWSLPRQFQNYFTCFPVSSLRFVTMMEKFQRAEHHYVIMYAT